jgi:hypothetical protein
MSWRRIGVRIFPLALAPAALAGQRMVASQATREC